jgi:hypothetical protein
MAIGRRDAEAVHRAGGSALDAALAHVAGTFSPAGRIQDFKARVAAIIAMGQDHPEVETRYASVMANLRRGITASEMYYWIDKAWRADREARSRTVATWGHTSRPRITAEILAELCLILRLMRRYGPKRVIA